MRSFCCYHGGTMSNTNRRPWKKVVNVLARQIPPMGEPLFPAVFGALIIVIAWMALPRVIAAVLAILLLEVEWRICEDGMDCPGTQRL